MRKTFQRTGLFVLALALAAPAAARQSVSRGLPDDPAKPQVRTFEMILGEAIVGGGRDFAKKAATMVPAVFQSDPPQVSGVAVHPTADRTEFVFHIQVPNIFPMIQIMNLMASRPGGPAGAAGPQAVSNGARMANDEIVVADAGVNAANRPDLEREYAVSVRDALVDAILDNAGALPIGANDTLTIFASGSDYTGAPSSLYQSVPRKLVIYASGTTLAEFKQGKLKREDAKQRILISSF